jgi:hypothetical protein
LRNLKTILKAKDLVNDPPYIYGIHLSINEEAQNCTLVIKFTLNRHGQASEKSTGTYINTIPPETAAAELKKAKQT